MTYLPLILAATDPAFIFIAVTIVIILWAVSAMSKLAKRTTEQEKLRRQQVRQSIERSEQQARQRSGQPARPPVQLAPDIARRIPPFTPQRPQQKRAARRVPVPAGGRPATNYNAMAQQQVRAVRPPPPLPRREVEEAVQLITDPTPPPTATPARKPGTVDAPAIRRWLKPSTLRQQFILTELFQGPLSLRE